MASYNTRRSGEGVNSVGARRPVGANFVSGGQLTRPAAGAVVRQQPQQQQQAVNAGQPQQQQQQTRPQQQRPVGTPQVKLQQAQVPVKTPQQQLKQQQQQPVVQLQQQQLKQEPVAQLQQKPQAIAPQQNVGQQQQAQVGGDGATGELPPWKAKKPWLSGGVNKISKKERQRRRNVRLSKILQPKNPSMILNEMVKGISYTFTESPQLRGGDMVYTASVTVDGVAHTGHGPSKSDAKNNASEAAIRYIVKNRTPLQSDDLDGDVNMEIDGATTTAPSDSQALPWQHVASLALYKLLSAWGEPVGMIAAQKGNQAAAQSTTSGENGSGGPFEKRAAKKLPENAAAVNPVMLVNQMLPDAIFEELSKVGNPPNVTFTFQCTVNGQHFYGSGSSKKAAKKLASYAVCFNILNIQYPPEVYSPQC